MSSMSSLARLSTKAQEAIATVMGPEAADALRGYLTANPDQLSALVDAAKAADGDSEDQSALVQKLLDIMKQTLDAKGLQQEVNKAKGELTAAAGATGAAAERLVGAERTFRASLQFVCDTVERINKAQKKINKLNNQLAEAYDSSDSDSSDSELSDEDAEAQRQADIKKKAKQATTFRATLQKKREQYQQQVKLYKHQIFEHFDETLGGMDVTVKCSKKNLELPRDLEKTTARPIIDAFKNYLLHRANEYYAVLPYIYYIVSSYNPAKGLYYCPPSKASDYDTVPEVLKHMYEAQSELLYREILTCIKQSGMATITQRFLCGVHKDVPASCAVDDGPMAVYCLLARYAKVDSQHLIDLEQKFVNAPAHFATGSPAHKVKHLKPFLTEVLELGVTLKASQTVIPIVDTLTSRDNKFAVELAKYAEGGDSPNDAAATLEKLFSDIVRTCGRIENASLSGDEIWHTNMIANFSQGYNAGQGKGGKGKGGKGKGKGKGKGGKGWNRFKSAYNSYKAKQPALGKCWAKGCQGDTGQRFRFCLECWRKGMELGHIVTYDDSKFPCNKDRAAKNKNKDERGKGSNYGFSKSNLQGMAALTEHITDHVVKVIDERLPTGRAHQVEPFVDTMNDDIEPATAKRSVWDRMNTEDQPAQIKANAAKKQKRVRFISNLAKYSQ